MEKHFQQGTFGVRKSILKSEFIYETYMCVEQEVYKGLGSFLFSIYYAPYIKYALQRIERYTKLSLEKGLPDDIANFLMEKLQNISIRILIAEMNICREEGTLKGKNESEEYNYYLNMFLTDKGYIRQLHEAYPVMYRSLREETVRLCDFLILIFTDFTMDRNEIERNICRGITCNAIIGIKGTTSDAHNGGKCVLEIVLDNGINVIYKPHSVACEKKFREIVGDISCGIGMHGRSVGMVERKDHGWVEKIQWAECETLEEVKRYYKRIGINLLTAYIFGTRDLHCENLIASGEYPVFVDLEVLINSVSQNEDEKFTNIDKIFDKKLAESVLYTGILPFFHWNKNGEGIDLSALGVEEQQLCPINSKQICNPKTSIMHLEYHEEYIVLGKSRTMLGGKRVEPENFVHEIVAGFAEAYDWVLNHKQYCKTKVSGLRGVANRYLVRDTQKYAMFLEGSYHPDFMMDGADREIYLRLILSQDGVGDKKEEEVESLLANDIPYFAQEISEMDLELIFKRINSLSEDGMKEQIRFINLAMYLVDIKKGKVINGYRRGGGLTAKEISKKNIVNLINDILDRILGTAIFNDEKTMASWVGMSVVDNGASWTLTPVNLYFYDGVAGIMVLLYMASKIMKRSDCYQMAQMLERRVAEYTAECEKSAAKMINRKTGMFEGEMSIVYAYLLLYKFSEETKYLNLAERHCNLVVPAFEHDQCFDLLEGNAGAIIVLLHLYEATRNKKYIEWANKAGVRLMTTAVYLSDGCGWSRGGQNCLAGFAHGASGIAAALGKLNKLKPDEAYAEIIKRALEYENSLYDVQLNNWKDLRDCFGVDLEAQRHHGAVAWCHGVGGILLSRIMLKESGNTNEVCEDMERAYSKLCNNYMRDGFCLCHGTMGNLLIMKEYIANDRAQKAWYARQAEAIEGLIRKKERLLPQEKGNPGLMTGMGGIVFFLMSTLCNFLPNILKGDV